VNPLAPDVESTVHHLTRLQVSGLHRVPLPIRKLLPDPLRTIEDWDRFTHADLATMPLPERAAEAFRLRVAIASVEPERVPLWAVDRLAQLDAAA